MHKDGAYQQMKNISMFEEITQNNGAIHTTPHILFMM